MSAFAKLFEVSNTQVVYRLDRDSEGNPTVNVHTCARGIFCNMALSWDDSDDGWDKAESYLASRTATDAHDLHADLAKSLEGGA